ncbi:hypothetical protein [Hydrogenophaga sp. RWCD_12]|uniref:hypothetical protein n=1 Tax=Hydrogenophaga sp. RWCD_12 TaxID=3391190 RepID=UPI00398568DE
MADPRLFGRSQWWPDALLALCGLLLACSVHGALPRWMVPVQWQMVWSGGFAESLANQGWFSLYANNFGAPARAPISFGLSGVWPMAVLIRLGLALPDAYAMTVALWLAVAFAGAAALALRLGAHRRVALMLATCWLTLPMVWGHAWYSMLALGIALLPTYLLVTLGLLQSQRGSLNLKVRWTVLTLVVAGVAVFMDGYTFVMYGVGSLLLVATAFVMAPGARKPALRALAVQLMALAVAYLAYRRYVGELPLESTPLDMFRGMALDLHYLVVPTLRAYPLWDVIGWSSARSALDQFGDASVWTTTFALPLVVTGLVAWVGCRSRSVVTVAASVIVVLAFYLALGPSLKVLSAASFALHPSAPGQMLAAAGRVETGNAWLFSLPGFSSMRATYRWLALALLGLWILIAVWMGRRWQGRQTVPLLIVSAVIALQLPDLTGQWRQKRDLRKMFVAMEQAIAQDMASLHLGNERTVFLPTGNDFLVNHIAARYWLATYNIGGDKNLELARRQWPASVRNARAMPGPGMALEIRNILLRGDAQTVVLPHFGLLDASHEWPCQALSPLSGVQPWSRYGRDAGPLGLQVSVPIDMVRNEQAIYLSKAPSATDVQLPALSLRSAPVGSVLQQRSVNGGWESVASLRLGAAPEARLLLSTPQACRVGICEQEVTLGWRGGGAVPADRVVFTNVGPECPQPMHEALRPVLLELRADPWFEVQEAKFFSVIRPSLRLRNTAVQERNAALADFLAFPLQTSSSEPRLGMVLLDGWHDPEPAHIWSKANASLSLPVPTHCRVTACEIRLRFSAFGASSAQPLTVTATHVRSGAAVTWNVRSPDRFVGRLPLEAGEGVDDIRLSIPQAASPRQRGVSPDDRVLGIGLMQIDIQPAPEP